MPFLITALVGFLVLPAMVSAPMRTETAWAATADSSAATTTAPAVVKTAFARTEGATPFTVKLTSYNAVPAQTDSNPFVTASGAFSNPEVVAARSGDLASSLPFGTVIEIDRANADTPSCNYSKVESQIGYRVVADAMNPRISKTVDVLLDQNNTVSVNGYRINPSIALGVCGAVSVHVVGHIAVKDIPRTQEELEAMVTNGIPSAATTTILAQR